LGINDLWLFIISGIALNIMPGPDSLYIIGRSATQGFRGGSMAAWGIATGTLVHILAAAFGLSAILATSAMAFTVIKVVGCCYLMYIGLSMLLKRRGVTTEEVKGQAPTSLAKVYYQGFLTNVLNPKIALFFLAFVPQFIAYDSPNKALSFIALGVIFIFNGMLWCHFLAWSSSSLSRKVKQSSSLSHWLNKIAGTLFIGFGVKLALGEQT